jgi:phosphate transport system protein
MNAYVHRPHTVRRFENELRELREHILAMAVRAAEQVERALTSVSARDVDEAQRVTAEDARVDQEELEIDELAFVILARRQPLASDLRCVIMALKIVTDIERIGDLAVNIAKRACDLSRFPPSPTIARIERLAAEVRVALRSMLEALRECDAEKADAVIEHDRAIDRLNTMVIAEVIAAGAEGPNDVARSLALSSVSRHLERIGDHVKNIAEMIIYLVRGCDVRHHALDGENKQLSH